MAGAPPTWSMAYGAGNTASVYSKVFEKPSWCQNLFSRNLTLSDLHTGNDAFAAHNAYLAVTGIGLANGWSPDIILANFAAEMFCPFMDDANYLKEDAANKVFQSGITMALSNTGVVAKFLDVTTDGVGELTKAISGVTALPLNDGDGKALLAAGKTAFNLFIRSLVKMYRAKLNETIVSTICTVHLALLKQGVPNREYKTKYLKEVSATLAMDIDLNEANMRAIFLFCLAGVNENNIAEFIAHLLNIVPAHAVRVRAALQQAPNHNLLCFNTIGRALRMYPTFDWQAAASCFPKNELENFKAAMQAVQGNEYYGYRKDLGAAKSVNMKNLATVARRLLIRIAGEINLKAAGSFAEKIPGENIIEKLISDFEKTYETSIGTAGPREATAHAAIVATMALPEWGSYTGFS